MRLLTSAVFLPALLPICSASEEFNNYETRDYIFSNPKSACSKLGASICIQNVTVNFANFVPAGTNLSFTQDYGLNTCGDPNALVTSDMCRVAMHVSTSRRSGITLEAWLPVNWTGRFLSTGNGGESGCIQYTDMAYTAGLGFATVGANNGHNGTTGRAFANNSDVLEDFAIRSIHTGVVVGKEITKQFYGAPHKKSYYLGCSTGGRQGFKSVQSYPLDFDGVLAGAPALNYPNLNSWSAHLYPIFGDPGNATYVPIPMWAVIHQEILNQCDGIDGVVDGIIEDPELCRFKPEALQCPPGTTNSSACLTSAQVGAVRLAFTDLYGVDGKLIYPRMQPGSEAIASLVYYATGPFSYSTDWFNYVVYNTTTWNPKSFTIADAKVAEDQNPSDIATWMGISLLFKRMEANYVSHCAYFLAQKLIEYQVHYHGQRDEIITSENSPVYYNLVSRTMGLNSSSLDAFYRFFRISGMGHYQGGEGAHNIGNILSSVSTLDPQNNVLLRIVDWVENGNAPETVTGTKFVNDDPAQGVAFVRNHCKYPKRNVCTDTAKYTSPDAWKCV